MTVLAIAPVLFAQQRQPNSPRIGYVYPAGGRVSETFEIVVGGQFLEGVTDAYVSGKGVQAVVMELIKPMTQKEMELLRDELKKLQGKRMATARESRAGGSSPGTQPAWTVEDERRTEELRNKLSTFLPRTLLNPAIAETVRLRVTISPDADPGRRDLRLRTPMGLTNPRVFCVDQLPEFSKKPGRMRLSLGPGGPKSMQPEPERQPPLEIRLPAVVNGQIMPGAVDRFHFRARRGQKLVLAVAARSLIPYLADAVPGWFQATVAIFDAKGKELTYQDDYRFHPDPVLLYQIPVDGQYTVEIKDAIYRGREDFVYRIHLGELPYVTGVFPLGCRAGTQAKIEMHGWNLPSKSLMYDARSKSAGAHDLAVLKNEVFSNSVPFTVGTLPECVEKEPNDQSADAQPVTLPIIVNGRIGKPGDWDVFRFEGDVGDEVVAEVLARRLDSPLDSTLRLIDATGRQLAFNDDHEDKGAGLATHHADSYLTVRLPAAGVYFIHVGDAQDKGGPEYGYRLRISSPMPDFELRVVPASVSIRGGTGSLTVYAFRRDGFSGEVQLALKDPPPGFILNGNRLPAGQDKVQITLTARTPARAEPVRLVLEGRVRIQDREVVRPAVPADDMMQAFAYWHLVPANELLAIAMGRAMARIPLRVLGEIPVRIPAGGAAKVRIGFPKMPDGAALQFELSNPPEGIAVRDVAIAVESAEIILQSDAAKVKTGLQGNLIVNAYLERKSDAGDDKAKRGSRRMLVATLPALPFEVVAD